MTRKTRCLNMSVCNIVRSSQRGGDVHPPGTDSGPVAPKRKEKLYCPDEKQQGSCPALPTRKAAWELHCPDRKAAGRCTSTQKLKRRHKSPSPRILRSQKTTWMRLCSSSFRSFFFFVFLFFAALVPRPAFYQLPVGGPDHPARPAQGFRWGMMPVVTDMFQS